MSERDKDGKWAAGVSGNRLGVSKAVAQARQVAGDVCPEAMEKLIDLMRSSADEKLQAACADMLLDRGMGRPLQAVVVAHDDDDDDTRGLIASLLTTTEGLAALRTITAAASASTNSNKKAD